ncbi:MAG: stage V sporulation protein D [Bacillota bacterium]
MPMTNTLIRKRLTIIFLVASAVLIIFMGRLGWIQFVRGEELRIKAEEMRMRDIPVEAKRGTIYDRNGRELVASISVDSVYAMPNLIKDPAGAAGKLAPVLGMDQAKLEKVLTRHSSYEWVKRRIDFQTAEAVRALQLEGIGLVEESKRHYRQEALASHVLGFAGADNQGLAGIEVSYDQLLAGLKGRIVIEHDAAGRPVPNALHKYFPPVQGHDLILTLDETIQYFVERELDNVVQRFNPKLAVIIIMDPKTGEILAMGNRPTFSPTNWQEAPKEVWDRNPAVWYNYEPGSTFKIITAAAALEEGAVRLEDRFHCPGFIKVADRSIRCWKRGGHGSQSFEEVIMNSCNPGFINVGLDLGKDRFYKYIKAFGFGQETNLALPGEASGIVIGEKIATNLNVATMSIGQSIAVTPIQLVTAVAAVANDGMLMKPQLVREVRDAEGEIVKRYEPEEARRVISTETARVLKEQLENVVVNGTGKNAFVEGYRVGGKTGTAQVVGHGGYVSGKYVASFAGFAPAGDPRIAVLVMVAEPQGGVYYGSQVAAPVFQAVARDVLRYLRIPETPGLVKPVQPWETPRETVVITVPKVINYPVSEAGRVLQGAGLKYQTVGEGNIIYGQTPDAGAKVNSGTTVILELQPASGGESGEAVTVPDLTGLSIKEAGNLLEEIGLRLEPAGSGLAVSQQTNPGSKVTRGTVIKVEFRPPGQEPEQSTGVSGDNAVP